MWKSFDLCFNDGVVVVSSTPRPGVTQGVRYKIKGKMCQIKNSEITSFCCVFLLDLIEFFLFYFSLFILFFF